MNKPPVGREKDWPGWLTSDPGWLAEARMHVIATIKRMDHPTLDERSRQSIYDYAYNSAPEVLSVTPRSYHSR